MHKLDEFFERLEAAGIKRQCLVQTKEVAIWALWNSRFTRIVTVKDGPDNLLAFVSIGELTKSPLIADGVEFLKPRAPEADPYRFWERNKKKLLGRGNMIGVSTSPESAEKYIAEGFCELSRKDFLSYIFPPSKPENSVYYGVFVDGRYVDSSLLARALREGKPLPQLFDTATPA